MRCWSDEETGEIIIDANEVVTEDRWNSLVENNISHIEILKDVPNPENYTLTLNEDGNASIQADCNQVTWPYELDGNKLTFDTMGPSTLAMCPEDSLDTVYLQRLGETATYVTEDGKLFLNLKMDAGNMEFSAQ